MPAPTPEHVVEKILALSRQQKSDREVARIVGVSRHTVLRLRNEAGIKLDAKIPTGRSVPTADVIEASGAALEADVASVGEAIRAQGELAANKLREWLEDETWPPAQRTRIALWVLERAVPSADAKEQSSAARANADAYAAAIAQITAPDPELEERMRAVRDAQNEVVAARKPHIVSDPDVAA